MVSVRSFTFAVACPRCRGSLAYGSVDDPSAAVTRASASCGACGRAWIYTVTVRPAPVEVDA